MYESKDKQADHPDPYGYPHRVYFSGGKENVHNLFETSPQPTARGKCYDTPCPHKGPWCNAAYLLTVTQHLPEPKLREDRCTPVAELGREGQSPAIFS